MKNKAYYKKFGKYFLLEKVAAGGMAEVFLAHPTLVQGIGKFCALKTIHPNYINNKEFISMFKQEAEVVMSLSHSNIVPIFDFGVQGGSFFIVMDFIKGRNLRQVFKRLETSEQSLRQEEILYIISEVASGLDYAHNYRSEENSQHYLIHRDVSPQNIMIGFSGEVKIVDFGIAKKVGVDVEETESGILKGKFNYMSPEQANGENLDPRTDIFSLGIILWELLTGKRLFKSKNEIEIIKKIRKCEVPSPREFDPTISLKLEEIVQKALAKDSSERYQTANAFQREVLSILNKNFPNFVPSELSEKIKGLFWQEFQDFNQRCESYKKDVGNMPERTALSENFDEGGDTQKVKLKAISQEVRNEEEESRRLFLNKELNDLSDLDKKGEFKDPGVVDTESSKDWKEDKKEIRAQEKEEALNLYSDNLINFDKGTSSIKEKSIPEGTMPSIQVSLHSRLGFEEKTSGLHSKALAFLGDIAIVASFLSLLALLVYSVFKYDMTNLVVKIREKYETPQKPIQVTKKTDLASKKMEKTLAAVASLKELLIRTQPAGASIEINGEHIGLTPHIYQFKKEAALTIKLEKNGYETYINKKFHLDVVGKSAVQFKLKKAQMGTLFLDVVPSYGVDIYIEKNGRVVKKLEDGEYIMTKVRAPSGQLHIRAVQKSTGRTRIKKIELKPHRKGQSVKIRFE